MLEIALLFALILVILISGNNLSVCTGPVVASRILGRKGGVALAFIGYAAGFVLQGSMLHTNIGTLLPPSSTFIIVVLLIAIAMFFVAHRRRVPEPLSITFTCALLGVSLAYGAFNATLGATIIGFWIVAGIIALLLSSVLLHAVQGAMRRDKVWRTVGTARTLLVILSFLTAFTLGANTIGIIYAVLQPGLISAALFILAILLGCIFFSAGELRRISNDIIPLRYANALTAQSLSVIFVEIATFFGIPLSNTQILTTGVYGMGRGYKETLLRKRPAITIIYTWLLSAALSFLIGYVATWAILAL